MSNAVAVIIAVIAALPGLLALYVALRNSHTESRRVNAEVRRSDIEALDTLLTNLRADYERLDAENENWRQQVAALSAENERVRQRLAALEGENAGLRERVTELERKNRELKRRHENLRAWAKGQGLDPNSKQTGSLTMTGPLQESGGGG